MEYIKNDKIEVDMNNLKSQIDDISSYITNMHDIYGAIGQSAKSIEYCQVDIKKLQELTTQLVEYSHMYFKQFEDIRNREDMYDEDLATLHTWTVNTQTQLDNVTAQLSIVSEKFDWYPNSCEAVYRYKVGDHIIAFNRKLNWFRRLIIKFIFGSCEIR